ncbi:hypothetical protein D3C71_1105580 [compost metagenome]
MAKLLHHPRVGLANLAKTLGQGPDRASRKAENEDLGWREFSADKAGQTSGGDFCLAHARPRFYDHAGGRRRANDLLPRIGIVWQFCLPLLTRFLGRQLAETRFVEIYVAADQAPKLPSIDDRQRPAVVTQRPVDSGNNFACPPDSNTNRIHPPSVCRVICNATLQLIVSLSLH